MKLKKVIIDLVILIILHALTDFLFSFLYPPVNPARATMIGATATLVLFAVEKKTKLNAGIGGLSIFSSALFGAVLVQAGILVSKSLLSAVVHVVILIVTCLVLQACIKEK